MSMSLVTPTPNTFCPSSRSALDQAELSGKAAEDLVAKVITDAGYQYFQQPHPMCRVTPDVLSMSLGFGTRIYDGYIPALHLYVEVKNGVGKETDSIDWKFVGPIQSFVYQGFGDIRTDTFFDTTTPPQFVTVCVGKKVYSTHARRMRGELDEVRANQRVHPWPSDVVERAHRIHILPIHEFTPVWLDGKRSK